MSLAPKWAHASAVLGLHLQLLQMEKSLNIYTDQEYHDRVVSARGEIARIQEMKD
jgi:hypothetical protein